LQYKSRDAISHINIAEVNVKLVKLHIGKDENKEHNENMNFFIQYWPQIRRFFIIDRASFSCIHQLKQQEGAMKHEHAPEDHESMSGTCRTRIRARHMQDMGRTRSTCV